RWVVNKDHRLELGQWLPLADGVVLRGPRTTYGTRLAQAGDVALLVEIADTSYAKDSEPKLRRYASIRIRSTGSSAVTAGLSRSAPNPSARGNRRATRGVTSTKSSTRSPWCSTGRKSVGSRYRTCCPEPCVHKARSIRRRAVGLSDLRACLLGFR